MVVSDQDEVWLKASISSVLNAVYPHVELCVFDDGSGRPHVAEFLEDLAASDGRVRVARARESIGVSEARDRALSLATGNFVMLLDAGDLLAPEAILRMLEAQQKTGADVLYADEDTVDISDRRSDPVFKPYWSSDLLLATMYVGRPCAIRRTLVEEVGGLGGGSGGAGEHDMMLRISERTDLISHVPGVFYHRRRYGPYPEGETGGPLRASDAAVREALERRDVRAEVGPGRVPGSVRVARYLSDHPTVSVIIGAGEGRGAASASELDRSGDSLLHEVITVMGMFDASAVNRATGKASGEYLLFLRNYREIESPDFIVELLREAQRPEVGAVGGQVSTANGLIRYGGSLIGLSGLTGSPPFVLPSGGARSFLPVVDHAFNPYAVSAECLMVRRSLFEEMGGFDEAHLPGNFYDLDLCFRLRQKGLLNVFVPGARVVVGEEEPALPTAAEIEYMWSRWWSALVKALHYEVSPLHATEDVEASIMYSSPV